MNITKTIDAIRQLDMSCKRTAEGEFRVNFKGGSESTAYYTSDSDDAIATAKAMMRDSCIEPVRTAMRETDPANITQQAWQIALAQIARLERERATLVETLNATAFALETVAHLRGLERELLPFADQARVVANAVQS